MEQRTKPALWLCILLTVLFVLIACILLFAALFSLLGELIGTALLLGVVAFALLGIMIWLWTKRIKALRAESNKIY
jgi:drug/metabolite transporter (DMT)-like permease